MRRYLIASFQPVSRRSGVTASVMAMKRSAQRPVLSSISSIGFAPRLSVNPSRTRRPSGISAAANTSGLISVVRRECLILSVELAQIHSRVHPPDLLGVAVEHQRPAPEKLADAPLLGLAPA